MKNARKAVQPSSIGAYADPKFTLAARGPKMKPRFYLALSVLCFIGMVAGMALWYFIPHWLFVVITYGSTLGFFSFYLAFLLLYAVGSANNT